MLFSRCQKPTTNYVVFILHYCYIHLMALGKPAPERQTSLDFTRERHDGVPVASAGPYLALDI